MSRTIDLSKPLSKGDREYLTLRGRYWEIEANDAQHGKLEPGSSYAGEVGAENTPGPDGTVGAARTTTGQDPRVEAASEASASSSDDDDAVSVDDLTVPELKQELEDRDVKPEGNKEDLQKQLKKVLKERGEL